ncbi:hypothetical protein NEOLEDRAFT_1139540 [Neolentinus lepideus HHB14362 ss-1]|uniref:CCR4-Not complex 3'-5'-exoribonuclease subunit Ccr4 n=1 Tax=Neolentinus lepideus HHB14362 ss-1 TaxID=1314782 RepID=A0A165PSF3_9AGAM|nr:hypothetical protein NEOLEDRAFT_1139540 [Neolentinus lepideus HHB14362 ss-1]
MYYPQQSPGIAHKLPGSHHDQSPWTRSHHPVLGPPGAQNSVGPPPTSPGYPLYNGNVHALHHHHGPFSHPIPGHPTGHHHQNSLSHFPSPPNGHTPQHGISQGSPGSAASQMITPHWQQQLLKCEMIRASRSPHHRARASAMASRTVTKSAIPITNPNLAKPAAEINGTKEGENSEKIEDKSEASPHIDHPNPATGPVSDTPRPNAIGRPENTWNSLDMGGVFIKNIPPTSGLFSFTFLANLYLNHNALQSIPPQIAKLRHLELLDLSGNQLVTVPSELGMLTQLKELYLFDNHIVNLPPELGSLHQLQTLGVEGNPLDPSLKQIVQKDGTPALVAYLRDSCPVPLPPLERSWTNLVSPAERETMQSDPNVETFTILSYNILAEKYATERMYGYTPSWALQWDYRKELILTEVMNYRADFLCMQEVDIGNYEEYFVPHLGEAGYEGVYWPKSRYKTMTGAERRQVDGCATFFNANKYQLVEKQLVEFSSLAMQRPDFKKTDDMFNRVLGKDHVAVVGLFENKETGTRLIVTNVHVVSDPQFRDVKLVQVALMVDEVEKIANNFAKYPPRLLGPPADLADNTSTSSDNLLDGVQTSRTGPAYTDGTKIPMIVCGDFNSIPGSGVYEFLSNGAIPSQHPDFMSHTYGRYTSDGLRHRLGLRSAYAAAGELPMTNYTAGFQGVLDYIWYSTSNLAVNAVLGEVDKSYLEKVVGFPNAHFPSDHICIMSELRVKPPPREAPARPTQPTFPQSNGSH